MTQLSFSDAEHAGKRKQTRRKVFLAEMKRVVPWKVLLVQIEPYYPKAGPWSPSLCAGDDAAGSPAATVVCAERPCDRGICSAGRLRKNRSNDTIRVAGPEESAQSLEANLLR